MRIEVQHEPGEALAAMGAEVAEALRRTPKQLPSKYFYDERGSFLFEEITRQPEYYLTRVERSMLERESGRIARLTRPRELIELGSGSASKTRLLIEAGREAGNLRRYVPLEVSREMAERTARDLERQYPGLEVHAVIGDFETFLDDFPPGSWRLVALLGSTIGNFEPKQAVGLLGRAAGLLDGDGHFLLGADLVKDRAALDAAYNDERGVTAEFNRNILNVVNDRLGGNFDPQGFEHVSYFNERKSRIETYLKSVRGQSVMIDEIGMEVSFAKGELMRTEISCKYTRESLEKILTEAGLRLERWITDADDAFALSLSTPA